MAISDNYVPLRQLGNGVTTQFSSDWAVLDQDYITVFLESVATGVQTPQVLGSDFTLVFDSAGFTVTFTVAPTSANYAVIGRDVTRDQTNPYRTSKGFQGQTLEDSLDKVTAITQDIQDISNRTITFPLGSTATGHLPTPIDDLTLAWSGTAGNVKNGPSTASIIAGAAAAASSAAAAASSAAAAAAYAAMLSGAVSTGGYLNKIRNVAMSIANRGISGTITAGSPAYTIDGYIIGSVGANVTWGQQAAYNSFLGGVYPNFLGVQGAAGCTDMFIKQRIESVDAAPLSNYVCTFQCSITNITGATLTPTLTVKTAASADNWSSPGTVLNAAVLQSVPNNTTRSVSYTFPIGNSAFFGAEVTLDFGNAMNGSLNTIYTAGWDLRATPGLTAGLNNSPPPVEFKSLAEEFFKCQRYLPSYAASAINDYFCFGESFSTSLSQIFFTYFVPPRITPTGLTVSSPSHFQLNQATVGGICTSVVLGSAVGLKTALINAIGTGTPYTVGLSSNLMSVNAAARLYFTGAEL